MAPMDAGEMTPVIETTPGDRDRNAIKSRED
jgi:hypothetical protein